MCRKKWDLICLMDVIPAGSMETKCQLINYNVLFIVQDRVIPLMGNEYKHNLYLSCAYYRKGYLHFSEHDIE